MEELVEVKGTAGREVYGFEKKSFIF